ncbi:MAG: transcription antitermination factor NusB [Fusobacteriaceae bacterium]
MGRRSAREELFKIAFEADMNDVKPNEIMENFLAREDVHFSPSGKDFFIRYVEGLSKTDDKIIEILKNIIEGWELDRIGVVERVLLKCATYELTFEETGYEIVANEAVELAKLYGDEKSYEFVNGVLAKLIKSKNIKNNKI